MRRGGEEGSEEGGKREGKGREKGGKRKEEGDEQLVKTAGVTMFNTLANSYQLL